MAMSCAYYLSKALSNSFHVSDIIKYSPVQFNTEKYTHYIYYRLSLLASPMLIILNFLSLFFPLLGSKYISVMSTTKLYADYIIIDFLS